MRPPSPERPARAASSSMGAAERPPPGRAAPSPPLLPLLLPPLLLLLLAGAPFVAAPTPGGSLAAPVHFTTTSGTFEVGSGGLGTAFYSMGEDYWWKISPCPGDPKPCQVLLWFTGFEISTMDYLYVFDGSDPLPTAADGSVIGESGCTSPRCLHFFTGSLVPQLAPGAQGQGGAQTPTLLRSTSSTIWVHWQVTPASSPGKGWKAHFATDSPHVASLADGNGLVVTHGGTLLPLQPLFNASRLAYTASLPQNVNEVSVVARFVAGLPWTPFTVTLPQARAGVVLGPNVAFINGDPYTSGDSKTIKFDNGLQHQPLVVSVRAMDEYTMWDYVVMVTPHGIVDTYGEACTAKAADACGNAALVGTVANARSACENAGQCAYVPAAGSAPHDCVATTAAACVAVPLGAVTTQAACVAAASGQCKYTASSPSVLPLATAPPPPVLDVGGAIKWVVPTAAQVSVYATPIRATEGDVLRFRTDVTWGTALGIRMLQGPDCPGSTATYDLNPRIDTIGQSEFTVALDAPGTYYFAGVSREQCQLGQKITVVVAPGLGLAPNGPGSDLSNKSVTVPRVAGQGLALWDQPVLTGTQWDNSRPLNSLSGWDGFHEWFQFDVHQGERVHIGVVSHSAVYFATGMLWDKRTLAPLATLSSSPAFPANSLPYPCTGTGSIRGCDFDPATPGGERTLVFDWVAPKSGEYLLSVRTFLQVGASYGNYSVVWGSDWNNLCVSQSLQCGVNGTCEIVEKPPGVYATKCACLNRWRGDNCETPAVPPVFLRLSGSTTIEGSIVPEKFKDALASMVDDIQPWGVTVKRFPQRLMMSVAIPGDLRDFDASTAAGRRGRDHFRKSVASLFGQTFPPVCSGAWAIQNDVSKLSCEGPTQAPTGNKWQGHDVTITKVEDFLANKGLRVERPLMADTIDVTLNVALAATGATPTARAAWEAAFKTALATDASLLEARITIQHVRAGTAGAAPVVVTVKITPLTWEVVEGSGTRTTAGVSTADAVFLLTGGQRPVSLAGQAVSNVVALPFVTAGACTYTPLGASAESCVSADLLGHLCRGSRCQAATATCSGATINGATTAARQAQCEGAGPCAYTPDDQSTTGVSEERCFSTDSAVCTNADITGNAAYSQGNCTGATAAASGRRRAQSGSQYQPLYGNFNMGDINSAYWPNPDHVDCYPFRCYDPQCFDLDTHAFTPLRLNCGPIDQAQGLAEAVLAQWRASAQGGPTGTVQQACAQPLSVFSIADPASSFDPNTKTLADFCPVSCGTCTPYLGGAGVIVSFQVLSEVDVSATVYSATFRQQFAASLNAATGALGFTAGQGIWGMPSNTRVMTETEIQIQSQVFETVAEYGVLVVHDTADETARIANELQNAMQEFGGKTFALAINATGGAATATNTGFIAGESQAAVDAATAAIQTMRSSAFAAAAAADGDQITVSWNNIPANIDPLPGSAIQDMRLRPIETQQAQQFAQQAAQQLITSGEGSGANYQTTVARAAAAAEHAAAMVLGLALVPGPYQTPGGGSAFSLVDGKGAAMPTSVFGAHSGQDIPDGFGGNTYVHDVSRGGYTPADFTQYGDFSQAAIAAAASAAAARLVALGADDVHPLDHLDPILSQAPSSQAFSDDPQLPSSTSRFSAQTKYWWIPDYLPGGRPPEQPNPPIITKYDDHSVELSWKAPYDWGIPIRGYNIEMRSCDSFYTTQSASECDGPRSAYEHPLPEHTGTKTSHRILNLVPGRMYFFHVRAFNIFDQYMHANNYGVYSYDSLAVTLWRVPDKMLPPVPHQIECHEPYVGRHGELKLYNNDEVGAEFAADADATSARPNCSIHLSWITPFAGAVANPLVDRAVTPGYDPGTRGVNSEHNNDIMNYRIFYNATQPPPAIYPVPDSFYDLNGTLWLEIPHPPDLKRCVADYTQPCPAGWDSAVDASSGNNICVSRAPLPNGTTAACASPQYFGDRQLVDIKNWEIACGIHWSRTCSVLTEHTVTGLQDSTDYFFIITAVNKGGAGAINAPYHPSAGYGNGAEHHPSYPKKTGAGFIWKHSFRKVFQGIGMPGADKQGMVIFFGEGDWSDTSAVRPPGISLNMRVMAMDRLGQIPELPGQYVTNAPYFAAYPAKPGSQWVGSANATNATTGRRRSQAARAPTLEEQIARWDDGSHKFGYHKDLWRRETSYPATNDQPTWRSSRPPILDASRWRRCGGSSLYPGGDNIHSATMCGVVDMHPWDHSYIYRTKPCINDNVRCDELARRGYFPGTVTSINADGTYAVQFDATCGAANAKCVDAAVPLSMIETLGQGSHAPAATTWRVPDAPASVTFGEVLATSVEVIWKPPPFDGNTNHEIHANDTYIDSYGNPNPVPKNIHEDGTYNSDPAETMTGGIVRGYRLFMQRWEQATNVREDWVEIMDARNIVLGLPSNESCVARDLALCASAELNPAGTAAGRLANCTSAGAGCTYANSECTATDKAACAAVSLGLPNSKELCAAAGACIYTPKKLETSIVVGNLDSDVNYVFTVIAVNIVGDSAHSVAAVSPPTQDQPIPDKSVLFIARPLCPSGQPKEPGFFSDGWATSQPGQSGLTHNSAVGPWLGCNNIPTTLLAVTAGGGTNVGFDYTLYKEEKERKCNPQNCQPETMLVKVWKQRNILNDTLWQSYLTITAPTYVKTCGETKLDACANVALTGVGDPERRNQCTQAGDGTGVGDNACMYTPDDPATTGNEQGCAVGGNVMECIEFFDPGTTASPGPHASLCTLGITGNQCPPGGVYRYAEMQTLITKNLTEWFQINEEKIIELGSGGKDCCTIGVPEDNYLLRVNASNSRGSTTTDQYITLRKCGCMDIFNSQYDPTATHQAPWMCESHTWGDDQKDWQWGTHAWRSDVGAGAEKRVSAGEFVQYEQHLTDSIFAVELSLIVESGTVDVYTSTEGPPDTDTSSYDTLARNVNARDHSLVMWEYRVPFNVLMAPPDPGVRSNSLHPYIDVHKSLYVGIRGGSDRSIQRSYGSLTAHAEDFARYKIRVRNVKFQEKRLNLPDWEATSDSVETGRYKFYELYFSESGGDMDIKVSVQCKIGNITLFVAKKDKYPSEFRTFTQTATAPDGAVAEVIDTWKPEEDRVVFIAVRGNEGDYGQGYPFTPTFMNHFIITARSYRYRGEAATLQPTVSYKIASLDSPFGGTEPSRYSETALDNFNFYTVQYSNEAYAVEVYIAVKYGVVDLYTNFAVPPTQSRYYQRAAGVYRNATIRIPFAALQTGVNSVYLGVFGRETDYSAYDIRVRELRFSDSVNKPTKLHNATWLMGAKNEAQDGYQFYRAYVGPEDTAMGHPVRSGSGSTTASVGTDPMTWGSDWTEKWVRTWSEQHRDEYDFDVDATVTVKAHAAPLPDLGDNAGFCVYTPDDPNTASVEEVCQAPDVPTCLAAVMDGATEEDRRTQCTSAGRCTYTPDDPATVPATPADPPINEEACAATDAPLCNAVLNNGLAVTCTRTAPVPPPPPAMGVSIYASYLWQYPTMERERDFETHQTGGVGNLTTATLTMPVTTFFGRELKLGVRMQAANAPYDIKIEYSVRHKDSLTSPVPKPHPACPAITEDAPVDLDFVTKCAYTPDDMATNSANEEACAAADVAKCSTVTLGVPSSAADCTRAGACTYTAGPESCVATFASDCSNVALGTATSKAACEKVGMTYGESCTAAHAAQCAGVTLSGATDAAKTVQCQSAYGANCVYSAASGCVAANTAACSQVALGNPLSNYTCMNAGTAPGVCAYTPSKLEQCFAQDAVTCASVTMDGADDAAQRAQCEAAGRCTFVPDSAATDAQGQPLTPEHCIANETAVCGNATGAAACAAAGGCAHRPTWQPKLKTLECALHGSCVNGQCICETGYYGFDCATIRFSRKAEQPRINFLSPRMNELYDRSPINISYTVANRVVPRNARVYLYVDGLAYPQEGNNMLVDTSDMKIYGLFRGKHTVQLVLTDEHGIPLNTDVIYFTVKRPGGCANDCSNNGVCMERMMGQYCICNDGWMGVDCSTSFDIHTTPRPPASFVPGAGLVEDLVRQMAHSVESGLQDSGVSAEVLQTELDVNRKLVQNRQLDVESRQNAFHHKMESEVAAWKARHQRDLDDLHRTSDRVRLDTANRAEHNRRVASSELEGHHHR
jgi:hypothetical protein